MAVFLKQRIACTNERKYSLSLIQVPKDGPHVPLPRFYGNSRCCSGTLCGFSPECQPPLSKRGTDEEKTANVNKVSQLTRQKCEMTKIGTSEHMDVHYLFSNTTSILIKYADQHCKIDNVGCKVWRWIPEQNLLLLSCMSYVWIATS